MITKKLKIFAALFLNPATDTFTIFTKTFFFSKCEKNNMYVHSVCLSVSDCVMQLNVGQVNFEVK